MAWRFATCPTRRSPLLVNPTTDGVVRPPSSLGITFGSPPSITATTEFVVPKSIPIIFAIASLLLHAKYSYALRFALESLAVKVSDAFPHQMDSGAFQKWDGLPKEEQTAVTRPTLSGPQNSGCPTSGKK